MGAKTFWLYCYFGVLFCLGQCISSLGKVGGLQHGRCETITVRLCQPYLDYNMTLMPNPLLENIDSQAEASRIVNDFAPLLRQPCAPKLGFFLCSLFLPLCVEQVGDIISIPPCRPVCERARECCYSILEKVTSVGWPDTLKCGRLPEVSTKDGLCMKPPSDDTTGCAADNTPEDDFHKIFGKFMSNGGRKTTVKPGGYREIEGVGAERGLELTPPSPGECGDRFVRVPRSQNNFTCAMRCGADADVLFRKPDKRFASVWMLVWACPCLLSTIITVLSFLIDTDRFKYPERPIVFLALCYCIYSSAYIMRYFVGAAQISCHEDAEQLPRFIILEGEGLQSTWCVVTFLVLYYFGMCSAIWWVMLTVTWFLAAAKKWSAEAIESVSSYFHLAAWAIPALKTTVILIMRKVDGDELSGLCYVGNQDVQALTLFVLVPLMLYLVVGIFMTLSGFIALVRIRKNLRHDKSLNLQRLEKLMAKIGIFSVFYAVPSVCVIGCYWYEFAYRSAWIDTAREMNCKWRHVPVVAPVGSTGPPANAVTSVEKVENCTLDSSIPSAEVFMLRLFMQLVVGMTSGMWVASRKTVESWRKFFRRRLSPRKSNLPEQPGMRVPYGQRGDPNQSVYTPLYYAQNGTKAVNSSGSHSVPIARV